MPIEELAKRRQTLIEKLLTLGDDQTLAANTGQERLEVGFETHSEQFGEDVFTLDSHEFGLLYEITSANAQKAGYAERI